MSILPDIPQTRLCGWKIAPKYAVFCPYGWKIAILWCILPSVWTEDNINELFSYFGILCISILCHLRLWFPVCAGRCISELSDQYFWSVDCQFFSLRTALLLLIEICCYQAVCVYYLSANGYNLCTGISLLLLLCYVLLFVLLVRDLDVELYPPKVHFSEDYISAPRGCCAPKFFTRARESPSLTSAPPTGDGAPLQLFQRGVKNWLKMQ